MATLHGELIGVVGYDRIPGTDEAEVAFVLQDAHQGRGLGPVLLEHLAAAARERGVTRFAADLLETNTATLKNGAGTVIHRCSYPETLAGAVKYC